MRASPRAINPMALQRIDAASHRRIPIPANTRRTHINLFRKSRTRLMAQIQATCLPQGLIPD